MPYKKSIFWQNIAYLVSISGLFMIAGCTGKTSLQQPPEPPPYVDLEVNGISLLDAGSVESVVGDDIEMMMDQGALVAHYYNATGYEILTFVALPSAEPNYFNHFYVTRVDKPIVLYPKLLGIEHYKTGKGIHLGMKRDELISLLGPPHEKKKEPYLEIFIYQCDEHDFPAFFKYYKKKRYRGKYVFAEHKLKWFDFGFGEKK